jgi:hypothetical protein
VNDGVVRPFCNADGCAARVPIQPGEPTPFTLSRSVVAHVTERGAPCNGDRVAYTPPEQAANLEQLLAEVDAW